MIFGYWGRTSESSEPPVVIPAKNIGFTAPCPCGRIAEWEQALSSLALPENFTIHCANEGTHHEDSHGN